MSFKRFKIFIAIATIIVSGCTARSKICIQDPVVKGTISQSQLLNNLAVLASDQMQGRKTGSVGGIKAAAYIDQQFAKIGLQHFSPNSINKNKAAFSYGLPFSYHSGEAFGLNLGGFIEGSRFPERYLVVTAHYDHLGQQGSKVFNGADDNASGVAGMLALAEYFARNQPIHSIIFLATDAEENGLYGSKAFIENSPVTIEKIKFNLNLDMIARGERKNKLYVAGLRRNKFLAPKIEDALANSNICVIPGHEGRSVKRIGSQNATNWDNASDHAVFIKHKIPYLYFGVDLHRDYHQSSDTFENVNADFFTASVESILEIFKAIDQNLTRKNVP